MVAITGAVSLHLSIRFTWKEVFTIGQEQETTIVKKTYTVQELMQILSIGRTKAYELCNSDCFKTVKIGRIIRINKSSFDDWFTNIND